MSADDKKKNLPEGDGLAELLDAFGGYDNDIDTEEPVPEMEAELNEEYSADEIAIFLPEVPLGGVEPLTEESEPQKEETDDAETQSTSDDVQEEVADELIRESANNTNKKKKKNKNKNKGNDKDKPVARAEVPIEEEVSFAVEEVTFAADDVSVAEAEVPVSEPEVPVEKPKEEKKQDKTKDKKKDTGNEKSKKEKKSDKKADGKTDKKTQKPEKTKKPNHESKENEEAKPVSPVRLVVVLTVICATIALLLATVNHFTAEKIAGNNAAAMLSSIRDIFDESVEARPVDVPKGSDMTSLYLVIKDGGVCGYAASVAPTGFGGPVNLMVGVDSSDTIVGVRVVSHSETPGLGSRVGGNDFLSQFSGKKTDATVDAISGATISSKAVMTGVKSVDNGGVVLADYAAEQNMQVISYENGASAVGSESALPEVSEPENTVEPPVTDPVTAAPVIETEQGAPVVSKGDNPVENIVNPPDNIDMDIYAEYSQVTTEYETLTTEPESTESAVSEPVVTTP